MTSFMIILMILVVEIQSDFPKLEVEDIQVDKNLKFFVNFLQIYEDFQIVFHADYQTSDYVQNLLYSLSNLPAVSKYRSLLVYNHDSLPNGMDFIRPDVSKVINLCFTERTELWIRLAVPHKLHHNDVVIFEERNNGSLMDKISTQGDMFLKLAGKVVVLKRLTFGVSMFTACFYCGSLSRKFHLLETTEDGNIQTSIVDLFPQTFHDMNGHLFHTEFVQYFPYILCEKNATKIVDGKRVLVCTDFLGIESSLMKTMSKKLNFTFIVHIMNPNATFFDMIKDVHAYKADIAFGGISMTADRIPLVQFTKQYNSEDFILLYLISISFQEIFDKFMEPFTAVAVWTLYMVSFILLALTLYVAIKTNTDSKFGQISIFQALWVLLHMVFEQSNANITYVYRSRLSCALVLAFWWWASMILINVYKSTMLSTVVHPPNTEPESLRQLVRAGYIVAGNAQFADIIRDLLQVSDPLYREALRKTIYGENTCDVFQMILPGYIAMLDEASTIQYEVRTLCDAPDKAKVSALRIARKPIRSNGHAWALQLGAPFRQTFDYYFNLILSSGLFKKWRQETTAKLAGIQIPKSREKSASSFMKLSVKGIFPLLAIYLGGICISIASLLVEIIINKCKF